MAADTMGDALDRRSSVAVVGAGRRGAGLALALAAAGYRLQTVVSRRPDRRRWLDARLAGTAVAASPGAAASATVVFICTPDDAVPGICRDLSWRAGQAAVHCSGILPVTTLEEAARGGALVGGFHPLQAFPEPGGNRCDDARAAALRLFRGIRVTVEAGEPLAEWLAQVAADLGAVAVRLDASARALHDAAASLAGDLVAALVSVAAHTWPATAAGRAGTGSGDDRTGATDVGASGARPPDGTRGADPREDALAALLPLVRGAVEGLEERGLSGALTGPAARGEVDTLRAHLAALREHAPDALPVYVALARRVLAELGDGGDSRWDEIGILLDEA